MPLTTTQAPGPQRHRRVKLIRFIVWQTIALSVVAGAATLGVSQWFTDESLTLALRLLTITGALAATIIPVIFYAVPPKLPRT
jgi:hypothetical protein